MAPLLWFNAHGRNQDIFMYRSLRWLYYMHVQIETSMHGFNKIIIKRISIVIKQARVCGTTTTSYDHTLIR